MTTGYSVILLQDGCIAKVVNMFLQKAWYDDIISIKENKKKWREDIIQCGEGFPKKWKQEKKKKLEKTERKINFWKVTTQFAEYKLYNYITFALFNPQVFWNKWIFNSIED